VTLAEALRDYLLTLPPVTSRVGARIYTLKFPQSVTAPALRLHEVDRISTMQLRGDQRIRRSRVQVDAVEAEAHGDPYDLAHALADAVRGDLASGSASGLVGFAGTVSGVVITAILGDDRREAYDAEARMVRVEQDFRVWFYV